MVGDGLNDSPSFEVAFCAATPAVDRPVLPGKADFFFLGDGIAAIGRSLTAARRSAPGGPGQPGHRRAVQSRGRGPVPGRAGHPGGGRHPDAGKLGIRGQFDGHAPVRGKPAWISSSPWSSSA